MLYTNSPRNILCFVLLIFRFTLPSCLWQFGTEINLPEVVLADESLSLSQFTANISPGNLPGHTICAFTNWPFLNGFGYSLDFLILNIYPLLISFMPCFCSNSCNFL